MDELKIAIECYESERLDIDNEITRLMDHGNIPDSIYHMVYLLLGSRERLTTTIYEMKQVLNAIESNLKKH